MQIFIIKSKYSKSFEQFAVFSKTCTAIIIVKNRYFWHSPYKWIFYMIVLAPIRICVNGNVLNENELSKKMNLVGWDIGVQYFVLGSHFDCKTRFRIPTPFRIYFTSVPIVWKNKIDKASLDVISLPSFDSSNRIL